MPGVSIEVIRITTQGSLLAAVPRLLEGAGLDPVTRAATDATGVAVLLEERPADLVLIEGTPDPATLDRLFAASGRQEPPPSLIVIAELDEATELRLLARGVGWVVPPSRVAQLGLVVRREVAAARRAADHLRLEARAAKTDSRLRGLVEALDGIVYEADPDTFDLLYVSPQAKGLLGFAPEDWVRPGFWTAQVHPADLDRVIRSRRSALAERGAHQLEYRLMSRDGRSVWVEDRVTVVAQPDETTRLRGILLDQTRVRDAQATVRAITDATADQIGQDFFRSLVLTLVRTLDVRNAFVSEVVSTSPWRVRTVAVVADGEIADNFEYDLADTPCLQLYSPGVQFVHVAAGVQQAFPDDARLPRMGADSFLGSPLYGSHGEPLGHLAILDDVMLERTERIQAVFSVFAERAGAELERRRAEARNQALQAQLVQAQKLEAIGTLAGGIAHDFNDVLMGILGNAEMALDTAEPWHPVRAHLTEILQATRHASDVVQRILTFSRRREPERRLLLVSEVLDEALQLLRPTLPSTIELVIRPTSEVPSIRGEASQLDQVIMNLATNAAQAIGARCGRIVFAEDVVELSAESPQRPAELEPGRYVRITVEDDGPGMDAGTLARIFEPFFTTKAPGQGTGLGLAVVHGVVRDHGGAITAESTPGRGSIFRVYLPAIEEATPEEEAQPTPLFPGAGQHVLFVDDEAAVVKTGRQMLERLGYRVTAVHSGTEAIELLRQAPGGVDVLVSDYIMPTMSGLDLAARARAIKPDLYVVLTTGNTEFVEPASRPPGVDELLPKPFATQQLSRVLHRLLTATRP